MNRKPTSSPASAACLAAAAEWLARLQSTDVTPETRGAAEQWIGASPENAWAWDEVNALWTHLGDAAEDPLARAMRARARAAVEGRRKQTP